MTNEQAAILEGQILKQKVPEIAFSVEIPGLPELWMRLDDRV